MSSVVWCVQLSRNVSHEIPKLCINPEWCLSEWEEVFLTEAMFGLYSERSKKHCLDEEELREEYIFYGSFI